MKEVRVAIVGFGGIARAHYAGYIRLKNENAPVRLVAVCDVNPDQFSSNVKINIAGEQNSLDPSIHTYTDVDSLIENELNAYFYADPESKELPTFENADTIYIGVTGDLPPMDFVASNGKAAGFNVALLTEIAKQAKVNIELVHIETGARPIALSSGKVDAVFWTKGITCKACNETWMENIEGMIVTESYFAEQQALVLPKFGE